MNTLRTNKQKQQQKSERFGEFEYKNRLFSSFASFCQILFLVRMFYAHESEKIRLVLTAS